MWTTPIFTFQVETFLNGPLLVEIHSFGGLKIQFRLPEEASFMELYHSTEVAFFQYGCSLSDFRLCTMDGSAVLPRNAHLKINQTSLRNETDHDAAEALRHVKEGRAKAAELVEALERTWHVVVHDISGALLAKMEMPGSSTSSDCKQRLRHITWRFEPEGCMHLVLNDGEVWDSPRVLGSFKNSEDTCELQLTLVWASAFQFFAVPDRSRGVLLAGKGIFRPEDVPVKEEGVSRVAFGMLKNQSTSGAKNFALHTGGRGRDDGSGEPTIGLLTELLPGFHVAWRGSFPTTRESAAASSASRSVRRNSHSRRMREYPGLRTLRPGSSPPSTTRPQPVPQRREADLPPESSPTALIAYTGDGEVQCTICCEDFVHGDHLRLLPCLHRYHVACIDRWLVHSQTCPVCKHSLVSRRNAFEEAVADRRPPNNFLDLRELSSPLLWLLACRRSHKSLSKALAGNHRKEVEEGLAQYSELLRFSQVLDKANALRPVLLLRFYSRLANRWYYQAVTSGLEKGLVKPGETKGIPSAVLLQVKNQESTTKLMEEVQKRQANYNMTLQRGLQGKGYLDLTEEDLTGLSNEMKSVWESHLGSAAVWRKSKYRVPIEPVREKDEKGSIFDHKEPETLALEVGERT
eukprot:symbB.v1.2.035214.t1/scaffold4692.1/size36308/2